MLRRLLRRSGDRSDLSAPLTGLADFRFAAVDVETTGLFPGGHDRIVEVAVVLFTLDGARQGEFETLVNPGRDLGPQHIHGLTMADLIHAPTFADICGDLAHVLCDRVLVAHNSSFDVRFLEAEFQLAGVETPPLPHLCTMRLAAPGGYGRRLPDVCARLGVEHRDRHTAAGDARAVAEVLLRWFEARPASRHLELGDCGCEGTPAPERWPSLRTGHSLLVRSEASRRAADDRGYLARLIEQLPALPEADSASHAVYLDLLERALEDRYLSPDESQSLIESAAREHIGAPAVRRLHDSYFEALTDRAWADGRLSRMETTDLQLVGEFLGIDQERIATALSDKRLDPTPGDVGPGSADQEEDDLVLTPGTTICFTGALRATIYGQGVSREQATNIAEAAGLVVLDNVTKNLKILVVADPQTVSGKAKKAREYGTRIVAEAVFWAVLGIEFDRK